MMLEVKNITESIVHVYRSSLQRFSKYKNSFFDSMVHASAVTGSDMIQSAPPFLNPDYSLVLPSAGTTTTTASLVAAIGGSSPIGPVIDDSWYWVVKLVKITLKTNSKALMYFAESKMMFKKVRTVALTSSNLLKSMVKLIVHEHFKEYQESLTMMEAMMGTSTTVEGGMKRGSSSLLLAKLDEFAKVGNERESEEGEGGEGEDDNEDDKYYSLTVKDGIEGTPEYRALSSNSSVLQPFAPVLNHVSKWGYLRVTFSSEEYVLLGNDDVSSALSPSSLSGQSSTAIASSMMTGSNTGNQLQWFNALVVLTFDHFLHVILVGEDVSGMVFSPSPSFDGGIDHGEGSLSMATGAGPTPPGLPPLEKYLSKLDTFEIDASFSVLQPHARPMFISRDGFRDSFEMKLPDKICSYWHNAKWKSTFSSSMKKLIAAGTSADEVRDWLNAISFPFSPNDVEPPMMHQVIHK